jgi:hypothetical protein
MRSVYVVPGERPLDRIFNEKYADPTYYSGLMLRHSSTLAAAR